jgi:hypothetical protein
VCSTHFGDVPVSVELRAKAAPRRSPCAEWEGIACFFGKHNAHVETWSSFNVFNLRNLLAVWSLAKGLDQRVLNFMRSSPDKRTRVLFINSALLAGADTWIHLLLLRNLSQGQFELHAAGQPGSPAPAFDELRAIPGIALRPTDFGPSLWRRSNLQKLASIAYAMPAAASVLGLVKTTRRASKLRVDIADRSLESDIARPVTTTMPTATIWKRKEPRE